MQKKIPFRIYLNKHLFCYIDSFSIVKIQIKRFYPCRTSPPPIFGCKNVTTIDNNSLDTYMYEYKWSKLDMISYLKNNSIGSKLSKKRQMKK